MRSKRNRFGVGLKVDFGGRGRPAQNIGQIRRIARRDALSARVTETQVAVIGGGITGAAIIRELSKF